MGCAQGGGRRSRGDMREGARQMRAEGPLQMRVEAGERRSWKRGCGRPASQGRRRERVVDLAHCRERESGGGSESDCEEERLICFWLAELRRLEIRSLGFLSHGWVRARARPRGKLGFRAGAGTATRE